MAHDQADTGRINIRYRVAMPLEIRQGRDWRSVTTEDVSYGGLFLRDPAPPHLHQLLRLRANLPFSLGPFEANAVVARRLAVESAGRQVAGVGLAFYGLGGEEREKWDRFIARAAVDCPGLAEAPFRAQPSETKRPPGGIWEDAPVLQLTVATLEDLFVLHSRDGSRAGIFLATEPRYAPDDRIVLHVAHAGGDAEFWIPCFVKRTVRTRFRGIAVEFAHDNPELLRSFRDFLSKLIDEAER